MSDEAGSRRIISRDGVLGLPKSWTLIKGGEGEAPIDSDFSQIPNLCFDLPEGMEKLAPEIASTPIVVQQNIQAQ